MMERLKKTSLPDIPLTSPIIVKKGFYYGLKIQLSFPLSNILPEIILVGKPNVGKSTLFNTMIGRGRLL